MSPHVTELGSRHATRHKNAVHRGVASFERIAIRKALMSRGGVVLIVVVVACSSSEPVKPPPLSATATWKSVCDGRLDVIATTEPGASIERDGAYVATAGSDGIAHGTVVDDGKPLTLTAKVQLRTSAPVVVAVPAAEPPITIASWNVPDNATLEISAHGKLLSGRGSYRAGPDEATLVELGGCRLVPGKVEAEHVTIEVTENRAVATIDHSHAWLATPGPKPMFEVAFTLPAEHGGKVPIIVRGPARATKAQLARFRKLAKEPLVDAMDPASAPRPRTILTSYDSFAERDLLDDKTTPLAATYVALVDYTFRDHAECRYGSGAKAHFASRTQTIKNVTIVAGKTGRVVTKRSFAGSLPKPCPSSMLFRGEVNTESLDGDDADETAVDAFIASFR